MEDESGLLFWDSLRAVLRTVLVGSRVEEAGQAVAAVQEHAQGGLASRGARCMMSWLTPKPSQVLIPPPPLASPPRRSLGQVHPRGLCAGGPRDSEEEPRLCGGPPEHMRGRREGGRLTGKGQKGGRGRRA